MFRTTQNVRKTERKKETTINFERTIKTII